MSDRPTMSPREAQAEIDRMIREDPQLSVKLTDARSPERARWIELHNWVAGIGASAGGAAAQLSPRAAAEAQIRQWQNDPAFYRKLNDPGAEGHQETKAAWAAANAAAAGGAE